VIVYLHGLCGDPLAFRAFVESAVHYGTVISLLGEVPCSGSGGRFSWGLDYASMDRRIRAAIAAVSGARGEGLDPEQLVTIGYSQGAARVAWLARLYPQRYRKVVLIGTPTEPRVPRGARLAVVAGEREPRQHMREGVEALQAKGVEVLYRELPGARHGEYGEGAPRVLGEVLAWLWEAPSSGGSSLTPPSSPLVSTPPP
jgi:predicted esterase